ncbi:MAG: ribosomal L7Ae/L30e/S12e/Gadd45 family protein [Clostridium sp.]
MNKIYSFLGLMQKSGNLCSGDDTVEIEIKKNNVVFLIISEDASNNTKNRFTALASRKNLEYLIIGDKDDLGYAIGKSPRSVLGIKNAGFAKAFKEKASHIKNGGECIVKN